MKLTLKISMTAALLLGMTIGGLAHPTNASASSMPEYLLTALGADRPTSLDDGWDCLESLFDGKSCRICMMDDNEKSVQDQIQSTIEMWEENYYGKDPKHPNEDAIRLTPVSKASDGKLCSTATGTSLPSAPDKE